MWVIVARAALVLAALGLAVGGVSLALRDDDAASPAARYSCPMHPEVTSQRAGECPICKMALEPTDRKHEVSPRAPSTPRPPASSMNVIPVATLSPLGKTWLPETSPPAASARPSDRPALATPRRRTLVDAVRASAWLETSARVAAVLYRDELTGLEAGEPGAFYAALSPRVAVSVRLSGDAPVSWDASTVLVHFEVSDSKDGPADGLRQGAVGTLELAPKARELLTFPESALLRSNTGPYVLVADSSGSFMRRSVQIGRVVEGQVVVMGGLAEHEQLVVGNAFFHDVLAGHPARAEPVAENQR